MDNRVVLVWPRGFCILRRRRDDNISIEGKYLMRSATDLGIN